MPRAARPRALIFATAPYAPDADGVLRAVLPSRCVFAEAGDRCSICEDHYRHRKTGPQFPLAVVCCKDHPIRRYTLYPPGHVPYGRRALVLCSHTGPPLLDPDSGEAPRAGTLLEAADQASSGRRWAEHTAAEQAATRRTQGRHLDLTGRLLGVHPEQDDGERERVATRLRVPTMTLRAGAALWSSSWTTRGAAVALVLAALSMDGSLLDRLLSAGYCAGLWARPRRWAQPRGWAQPGRWVIARSVLPEHVPSIEPGGRDPPPTNSQGAG